MFRRVIENFSDLAKTTMQRTALAAALVIVTAMCPSSGRAEALDNALLKQAPEILKFLKDKGYQTVGVLKFRVEKKRVEEKSGPVTDNAGPINLNIADRLELALILANRVQNPLNIIHQASAVAATIPGASHLEANRREKLFTRQYPLAWGDQAVTPDAFLTGVVTLAPDLQKITVGIMAFDRQNPLEKVALFDADIDPFALIESGESFSVRGALDADEQQLAQAVKAVTIEVRNEQRRHPLDDPTAPVELEIRYDNKRVPLEFRNGQAFAMEPREGQKVSFVLKRKQSDSIRYGVVLKVNGLNTFQKQRLPDLQCRKWILVPDKPPITRDGFQMTDNQAEAFNVLSKAASKQKEMDYGADVGTISLVVFRELSKDAPAKPADLLAEDSEDLAALSRGAFPVNPPANLAALQAQLRDDAKSRGIIGAGAVINQQTERINWEPYPIPIMSATVTYYRRQ